MFCAQISRKCNLTAVAYVISWATSRHFVQKYIFGANQMLNIKDDGVKLAWLLVNASLDKYRYCAQDHIAGTVHYKLGIISFTV